MIRAARLLPLLLVCLCPPARCQERPRGGDAPITAGELAAEARRFPTTAQNVRQRLHRLTAVAQFSERSERYLPRETALRINALLDEGRLMEAATIVDDVLRHLETIRADEPGLGPDWGRPPNPAPARPLPAVGSAAATKSNVSAREDEAGPWRRAWAAIGLILFAAAAVAVAISRKFPGKTGAPEPGRTLSDKYSIVRKISSGGMGEIYEGQDLQLGRRVALKRMLPDRKLDAALRQKFLQEARTVAKLTHPYIVQIHDCLESGADVYLVFEFVKGMTLAQRLTEKPRLPLKECRRIFSQVCPAVDYAHKNHILHRDLKPANIMIDESGIARVMDFGIALESTCAEAEVDEGFLDASGTPRYMPPEQHSGKCVRASDVYAMGVCLYEMTTGTLPFAAGSVEELLEQKRGRLFQAPSTLVAGLPQELDLFVTAVLAPDPQDRIGSALEFLELLEGIPA